jgi:hypothetical protein
MAVGNDLSYVADGVGFGEMRNDTRLDWCWRASKERTNRRARGWGGGGRSTTLRAGLISGFSGGKKNIKFFFRTKHRTRKNSSVS